MKRLPPKVYRNIAIEKGGFVDQVIEATYETHLFRSREQAIEYIIKALDLNWDLLLTDGSYESKKETQAT